MLGRDHDRGGAHRLAVDVAQRDLALGVGAEMRRLAGMTGARHVPQDVVGELDRRRHQRRGLGAGEPEHDALIAGALVLVARRIHALGDVRRLRVQEHLDLGRRPMEAGLLVADLAHRVARDLLDPFGGDGRRAADLARDHDPIGGRQRLGGDPGARVRRQVGVDDAVGDAIADLVGMTLGHRLAGEQVVGPRHADFPLTPPPGARHRWGFRQRGAANAPGDADRQEATTFVSASAFLCRDGRRRSRDLCAAAPSGTSQGAAQCAAGRRFWSRLASALVSSNRRLRTAASGIRL